MPGVYRGGICHLPKCPPLLLPHSTSPSPRRGPCACLGLQGLSTKAASLKEFSFLRVCRALLQPLQERQWVPRTGLVSPVSALRYALFCRPVWPPSLPSSPAGWYLCQLTLGKAARPSTREVAPKRPRVHPDTGVPLTYTSVLSRVSLCRNCHWTCLPPSLERAPEDSAWGVHLGAPASPAPGL